MNRRCSGSRVSVAAGLLFLVLASVAACTNENATLGVSVVPPRVSFSDVNKILTDPILGCTYSSSCHVGSSPAANMDLQRIFDPPPFGAVNVDSCEAKDPQTQRPLKRIAPFDPDHSYLLKKLENTQKSATCMPCTWPPSGSENACGLLMPSGSTGLPAADIEIIKEWIKQGAQSD